MIVGHGYEEASWWYKEFITKEEWKRKTAWIILKGGTLEYETALRETYRDLLNGYWSLSRLTTKGSYEFLITQRKMYDLWREFLHISKVTNAKTDFPEMCHLSFENQTDKKPFILS